MSSESQQSAHQFGFAGLTGGEIPLSRFKGKPVLVVNVASRCGLTPQYAGLQKLWEEYGKKGLVVLGVPSNDFGAQEPGNASEIKNFCDTNYKVSFPMTAKEKVIGGDAHPFYKWVVSELGEAAAPKWNFHKYLVAKDGSLLGTFGSRMPPEAPELKEAIEEAL